jgi:flagellar hook-length control protein FliK
VLTAAPEVHHLAPTPQPVPEQLVHVLSATRDRGDGSYRLAVEVHPAELGRVRLDVHVDGGTVHVSLHADHAATSALLEQSLDQLRAALESAGVSAGQLSLGDRGAGRDTGTERGRRSGGTGGTEVAPVSTVEATAPVTRPLLGDRALDVLL